MLRLAGGTDESRARIVRATADVWPYVNELFRDDAVAQPSSLRAEFDAVTDTVLAEAWLDALMVTTSSASGRHGPHATPLGHILAEMQVLARRHPGATW